MVFTRDIKSELAAGGAAMGLIITELRTPLLGPMLDAAGLDFIIIDMEHGPYSYDATADMIAACRGTKVVPFVRVAEIKRECFTKVLDAGAQGLLVPGVESVADVERCVEFARYAPVGKRGVSLRKFHSGFAQPNRIAYTREANRRILLMAQIETAPGLAAVDDIAAVAELDLLFVGPSDLAHSLSPDNDQVKEVLDGAIARIIASGRKHGKLLGINTASAKTAAEMLVAGVRLITMGTDVGMLIDACTGKLQQFRAAVPAPGAR